MKKIYFDMILFYLFCKIVHDLLVQFINLLFLEPFESILSLNNLLQSHRL